MAGDDVSSLGRRVSWMPSRTTWLLAAGVALTFALGQWQLGRAAEKEAVQAALDARGELELLPPVELARDAAGAAGQLYRRARLLGRWDAPHTVYLDNRPMDEHPGLWVYTPLRLGSGADGSRDAVLVQRGWIPRNVQDRSAIAPYDTAEGEVSVEGHLAPLPGKRMALGEEVPGPIRQNLDLDTLALGSGLALRPLVLVQHESPGQAADGLRRAWARPTADVHKHYAYAAQWFAMSALLLGWAAWVRFLRPRLRSSIHPP